ncbi:condensation domain-containing protein, partial [Azotobacter chroococcum]|nr:condensation domain-containing protein [Azotobacter chroococcum]
LWQLDPGSTAYHITGALRIAGPLDVPALQASFNALAARHEALRTRFRAVGESSEQVILAQGEVEFSRIDCTTVEAAARAARVRAAARGIGEAPFDLTRGPLLRVGLIREAADRHVLVLAMHHIVADEWSLQLIVDEFVAL